MNMVVDGLLVNYADEGGAKSPVVVLLHGWASSMATFGDLARHLKTHFRVVRLDLPGFAGSEQPAADWHIADYAQFVQAFLTKLGVQKPYAILLVDV